MGALLLGVALCLTSSQCITENGRCSKNQVRSESDFVACECAPGYVLDEDRIGCVSCGAHAKADGSRCVCEDGYARANDTGPCTKVEGSSAGSACSEAEPCTDPNPYCADADGSGYCTQRGCTRNDDCPEAWLCASSGSERYCRKPPTGLGDKCGSNADCESKDAKYCEAIMSRICMINDCATDASICPSQYSCCDLSALIAQSLCVPTAQLPSGMCPAGGRLVAP